MLTRLKWAYAFLGGAFSWFTHLFFTAAIGESVCTLEGTMFTLFDYPASGWMLVTLSALCFVFAVGAGFTSLRMSGWASKGKIEKPPGTTFIGRAGFAANTLFSIVILAQTVPIFVLLNGC